MSLIQGDENNGFLAFVEFAPGEGDSFNCELEYRRVEKVADVLSVGDSVKVKLIKIDNQEDLISVEKLFLKNLKGGRIASLELIKF